MSSTDVVARDPLYGNLTLNWKWMLGLGILMAVLGIVGLFMTYALTIVGVVWFGVLAIIGGIAQVFDAFKYKGWKSFGAHLLLGLLYLVAGVVLIAMPVQSAWWLTLLIGATFIVTGVLRVIMAFQIRGGGAAVVWLGLTGAISVVLGIMIFGLVDFPDATQLATPEAAAAWFRDWGWIIGLFIALEFLTQGVALAGLALTAKKVNELTGPTAAA
ncbi:HdeD family acid-resistance protein [Acuticoccus sp. I52.16.1]|uniref:HdeD family acid-resistance protein n=1 Tax=Acuticoccus sp. I52.16.1 TaxID=2928472 RepID=UPI001FCFFCC5|nr:DUF308 domain-containing protein [Acuticoccus sp. I52.16.1]UOM34334.1 DUF308 domain-containing protein [Acuticoccus sp. I52.16.1]